MQDKHPILVEVTRGKIVESQHRGVIVVVEPSGKVLKHVGDYDLITSTRSTIKPIQAIPFVTTGAADHFNTSERELAVVCASHEGEPIHTETVGGMLARAGLDESALRCGPQVPYNIETAKQLEARGEQASQLHNNCSGKHAGMLMTAVFRGLSLDDYLSLEHPIQKEIIAQLSRFADLDEDRLTHAIDGCSAPTFAVPLRSLAQAFARLVGTSDEVARRITSAMIDHPEMVGGTKGRFDTDLLRAAHGKLICKIGAEASYAIGVLPCDRYPQGLGIALKIEDGSYRGLGPAVVETLIQLEVLDPAEAKQLESYHQPKIDNRRGLIVGEIHSVFEI